MNVEGLPPILNVSDIAQSFAWFEKLGWRKCWDWGDPPTFGAVHEQALANGMTVTWPPTDEPWNVREFHLRHPDGHTFRVGCGINRE